MSKTLITAVLIACAGLTAVLAQETGRRDPQPSTRPATRAPADVPPAADTTARQPSGRPGPPPLGPLPAAQRPASAVAEPVPVLPAEDGDRRHERTVCRLKSVPAVDAATTINQLLRAEGQTVKGAKERSVVIVPDPVSNSLLIGGPPDAIDEVRQLIEQIDRPAAMIALEVTIAEAPIEEKFSHDEKPEHMEVLSYARLTTLDNQPAFLKIERREAMISGTSVTPMGQANSVRYENLGTVVGVTPRVWPDDVVTMEIDVDDSRLGPVGEGTIISAPKEGEPVRTPNIDAMTSQSTIRIRDGQTAIMGGMSRQAKLGKQRLVLITPHVLRTDGNPKAPH